MTADSWPSGFTPNLAPGEERHTVVGDIVFSVRRLKGPGLTPREAVDALLLATECRCLPAWVARGFHSAECAEKHRKYVEVLSSYLAEMDERL